MNHQLEILFDYEDSPQDDSVSPKLDLLDGLSTVKDLAHRNLLERISRASNLEANKVRVQFTEDSLANRISK